VPPEEAIALASRVGELWGEMTDDERRRFVEEWFEEVRLGRHGTIGVGARETYREIVFSALEAWWRSDPSRQREGTQLHHVTVDGFAEWIHPTCLAALASGNVLPPMSVVRGFFLDPCAESKASLKRGLLPALNFRRPLI